MNAGVMVFYTVLRKIVFDSCLVNFIEAGCIKKIPPHAEGFNLFIEKTVRLF